MIPESNQMHIAILGWGSLLWDKSTEFDKHHGEWEFDGPVLKIEFSRISQTRGGALTLVIDQTNGSNCCVAHARSKRRDPESAIFDLRFREGTTNTNIGVHFADGSFNQYKDQNAFEAISAWAKTKAVDVVVWTDLSPNFQTMSGSTFSITSAIAYLRTLNDGVRPGAAKYLSQAPAFVNTPLRSALQAEPWFKP